jgi:transcriptional regulator with XRE-family HTH domain
MPSPDRLAARRFELMAAEFVQRMGARIAQRRNELGLSQVDVARALPGKVDGSQVSRWERGLHKPGDDTLERLGVILEVPVSYFMTPEPDHASTPDPFPANGNGNGVEDRLEQLAQQIAADRADREANITEVKALIQAQNELLAKQDAILEEIRDATAKQQDAAHRLERMTQEAVEAMPARPARAPRKAPSGTRSSS